MKKYNGSQHIIHYSIWDEKVRPIRKPRSPDYDRDIDRVFDDLRKMFEGDKGYSKHRYQKTRYGRNSGRGKTSDQRCMVKMIYSDDKKGHKNFLTNYMPQMNKNDVIDKPVLFGASKDAIGEDELNTYQNDMTDRHFKFIISPESPDVPIKPLVRSFMIWLERESGHKLQWLAVEHRNTDHPHAHILINGKDRKTRELIKRFERDTVSKAARQSAAQICTRLVGQRTPAQILASRNALHTAKRYTTIDSQIESKVIAFDQPTTEDNNIYESSITTTDNELLERLDILCALGLARKFENTARPLYWLETGWANKLRSMGRYNTFIDARKTLCYTTAANLLQYTSDIGPITGVITRRITMDDENVWNNAIVIEDKKNDKAWYVPLSKAMDEKYMGATIECNVAKGQSGQLRPVIRIIGGKKDMTKVNRK